MTPALLEHLPALQVVVPLICAALCVFVPGRMAHGLASLAAVSALAAAALLLFETLVQGPRSYLLGGWAAPWGIEYRVDPLSAFVLVVVSAVAALLFPFTRTSVEREVEEGRRPHFYALLLLSLAGMTGITITGDLFNLFVFLEIASLAAYVLVAFGRERRARLAALRYLVAGTVGATFVLIGIGLLYASTGTLNMRDVASRLAPVAEGAAPMSAFAFLVLGIAIKMAIFPLHAWLPGAYAHAPSVASAFLAGSATKVAVYALIRVIFGVFGADYAFGRLSVDGILIPCAALGVLAGALMALYQRDLRRTFAWSSVSQIAYMALGTALASATGLAAALVHLMNHALMKSAIFVALGAVAHRIGSADLDAVAGLGRRMPLTFAGLAVACLGLATPARGACACGTGAAIPARPSSGNPSPGGRCRLCRPYRPRPPQCLPKPGRAHTAGTMRRTRRFRIIAASVSPSSGAFHVEPSCRYCRTGSPPCPPCRPGRPSARDCPPRRRRPWAEGIAAPSSSRTAGSWSTRRIRPASGGCASMPHGSPRGPRRAPSCTWAAIPSSTCAAPCR